MAIRCNLNKIQKALIVFILSINPAFAESASGIDYLQPRPHHGAGPAGIGGEGLRVLPRDQNGIRSPAPLRVDH